MNNLLTLTEAAERLRKTDSQLRWMIHNKTAPRHAKIGGRVVFRQTDVDAYVAAAFGEAVAA